MLNKDFVKVLQQFGWLTQGQPAQVRSALDNAERHLTALLDPLIDRDAILCTDGAHVHQKFARLACVTHRPTNVSQGIGVVEGAFHIQNVNACDSRLQAWMRRFQGVLSTTWSAIWAGDACLNAIASPCHLPIACKGNWEDARRNS
ncbi:MAG: hypothetical protein H7224_01080 [Polaromonas sp.]|nr:hypothetical protein [Polaromonas sp.]